MAIKGKKRKWLLKFHLVTGLVTGVIVLIVSITGSCWVFKDEIESLYSEYKKVVPDGEYILTASNSKKIAQEIFPQKHIHGVLFGSKNDAVEVILYQDAPLFYRSVFINPYTNEILATKDHLRGFFAFMLDGHMHLWLPRSIGGQVVKYSILIFLITIFSGILLWIPKRGKRAILQRFRFDWKKTTKWRRKNFDLHSVLGFYIYIFAFLFGFTGSVISFPWFYYIVFKSAGGVHNPRFIIPKSNSPIAERINEETLPIDLLIPMLSSKYKSGHTFELHFPDSDTSSIYVEIENKKGVHYDNDYRFFDQVTLEEIPTGSIYSSYNKADFADLVIRMNYDIHIGAIGGFFGKLIAFITSLLVGSMPVTGFLIWWGRKFK